LTDLGVEVLTLPFELHPEIPQAGRRIGEQSARYYERIAEECREVGLPFAAPDHLPNTRRVLETAEWVRIHQPEVFEALHQRLFRAHFVDGRDLGNAEEIDNLLSEADADAAAARAAVDAGAMRLVVDTWMQKAVEVGATGTPAWLFGDFLVPGVQPRPFFERLARRFRA
jgi:predicted DsbA family dithiol-disulfide isomerase